MSFKMTEEDVGQLREDDRVAQLLREMAALKHEKQEQENTLEESQEELNSLRQRSERMELEIHALKQAAKMLCEQLMAAKSQTAPPSQPIEEVRKRDTELLREALESLRAVSQERDHYEKEVGHWHTHLPGILTSEMWLR
jgi:hypothetical protein